MMRMSVDLPAPLGPSRPNIPGGIDSDTSSSARVPFGYVFERPSMRSSMGGVGGTGGGSKARPNMGRWRSAGNTRRSGSRRLPEHLQREQQQGARRNAMARNRRVEQ